MPGTELTQAAFIHSRLDDLGLTLQEFRVYCHAVRRAGSDGGYYESVPNCAKHCRIKLTTARAALQRLTTLGLLKLVDTPSGKTWTYRITPLEEWADPVPRTDGVSQTDGVPQGDGVSGSDPVPQTDATPPISGTGTPPFRGTTKVIPKGNPSKGERPPAELEDWQLEKDIERLRRMITREADKATPNQQVLLGLRSRLKLLRAEVARRSTLQRN